MKPFSGFVPINFKLAGRWVLLIGIIGLIVVAVSWLSDWFVVPSVVVIMSLAFIPISLYLMYVVPKEDGTDPQEKETL